MSKKSWLLKTKLSSYSLKSYAVGLKTLTASLHNKKLKTEIHDLVMHLFIVV